MLDELSPNTTGACTPTEIVDSSFDPDSAGKELGAYFRSLDDAKMAAGGLPAALLILAEIKEAMGARQYFHRGPNSQKEERHRCRQTWNWWLCEQGFSPDTVNRQLHAGVHVEDLPWTIRRRAKEAERARWNRAEQAFYNGNLGPMRKHYPTVAARWEATQSSVAA